MVKLRKESYTPVELPFDDTWLSAQGHFNKIVGATSLPDNIIVAWGYDGSELFSWDAKENALTTYHQDTDDVFFSPSGKFAAWCSEFNLVVLKSDGSQNSFSIPDFPICDGVAVSPDGNTIAIWAHNRLSLLSISTGELQKLQNHPAPLVDVAFSNDGSTMASAASESGGSGKVYLWQVKPIKQIGVLDDRSDISEIVFSPDRTLLAVHGMYNLWTDQVQLWNVSDGKKIGKFELRFDSR